MAKNALIFLCMTVLVLQGYSQKTLVYNDLNQIYTTAVDLFNKAQYNAAQVQFDRLIKKIPDPQNAMRVEAEYKTALCSYEMLHNDSKYLLKSFINNHSESHWVSSAGFYLGNCWFREKNYRQAADEFALVHEEGLQPDVKDEYNFKYGYSLFQIEDFTNALGRFMQVKDHDNEWKTSAIYYYSHIHYQNKNYSVALDGFRSILQDENYGPIVPYYIAQIYYLQKNTDELLAFIPTILENPEARRQGELARMLAEAYWDKKNYSKTAEYMKLYMEKTTEPVSPNDYYILGYSYYAMSDWDNAIQNWEKISLAEDTLSQNVSYHLAYAYLKTGKQQFALNSFFSAYQNDKIAIITEDALFNYAKLSYEMDYDPYNLAIKALEKYINTYPNSKRGDEFRELLAGLLVATRNYERTISTIEAIKNKNDKLWTLYQKVNLYRGFENFNDRKYNDAIENFSASINYAYDRSILAQAIFWKAESYTALDKYDSAGVYFDRFIKYPASEKLDIYNRGYYGLGYAQIYADKFEKAAKSFENFISGYEKESADIKADAHLRLGDCYYMTKRFADAIDNYDKTIAINRGRVDYAYYKKALSYGAQGNLKGKVNTLEAMAAKTPKSDFIDDALFELGVTYEILDRNQDAFRAYQKIYDEHTQSAYVSKALLKKGLLHRNLDQNDAAIATLRKLILEYQGSEEARQAWMTLKNIYVENDQVDEIIKLAQELNQNIDNSEDDSLTYTAAENKYMSGKDMPGSIKSLNTYLEKYPNGGFIINAHFYLGESYNASGQPDEAIKHYNVVCENKASLFYESALLKSARIYYAKKDYPVSIQKYKDLIAIAQQPSGKTEANRNIMRAYFEMADYSNAQLAASAVLAQSDVNDDDRSEADLIRMRSFILSEDFASAKPLCEKMSKNKSSESGAESSYYLALMDYKQAVYPESEKKIFELINDFPSYEFWVAKSLILLSDIYMAGGNLFQAKHALKSVIENYKGEDLVKEAQDKYNTIVEMEKAEEQRQSGNSNAVNE